MTPMSLDHLRRWSLCSGGSLIGDVGNMTNAVRVLRQYLALTTQPQSLRDKHIQVKMFFPGRIHLWVLLIVFTTNGGRQVICWTVMRRGRRRGQQRWRSGEERVRTPAVGRAGQLQSRWDLHVRMRQHCRRQRLRRGTRGCESLRRTGRLEPRLSALHPAWDLLEQISRLDRKLLGASTSWSRHAVMSSSETGPVLAWVQSSAAASLPATRSYPGRTESPPCNRRSGRSPAPWTGHRRAPETSGTAPGSALRSCCGSICEGLPEPPRCGLLNSLVDLFELRCLPLLPVQRRSACSRNAPAAANTRLTIDSHHTWTKCIQLAHIRTFLQCITRCILAISQCNIL